MAVVSHTKNLPEKVLVIGSGPIVIGQAAKSVETRFGAPFYAPIVQPLFGLAMEVHLSDLPDSFIIKLDGEFMSRLFDGVDSRLASKATGVSRSYFYHLKTGRHGFRLALLRKFLALRNISFSEAELYVQQILSSRGGRISVAFPIRESSALARLVGHCFGDGNISSKKAEFDYVNGDAGLIENVKSDVKMCFGSNPTFQGANGDGTSKVTFSNLAGKILELVGAPRGRKVFSDLSVPPWIMGGSADVKKAFLQALFDDDGSVLYSENYHAKNVNLHLTRSSEHLPAFVRFLGDLKQLLYDLGIGSSAPYVARKYFVKGNERVVMGILIHRKADVRRFWETIGFSQEIKRARLQLIIQRGEKIATQATAA